MKRKSHITCHLETSLRVAERIKKSVFHFQIILFILFFSFIANAQQPQPYEWQWAINGGGSLGGTDKETIHDVKVGTDGNYYFIASIYGTGQQHNAQLDGIHVYPNNQPSSQAGGSEDIFLFSTTCDGQVRWSRTIGGGSQDLAFNLVLDSNDNVYIGGYFNPAVTNAAGTFPVRFSATDSLPTTGSSNVASDYWKKIFLVKYDKDGNYWGKKALQGNVNSSNSGALILDLAISNDTLHFVVGLLSGTHLDNQVTVPNTVTAGQYHLAKYDTDLNYISSIPLPVADGTGFPTGTSRFTYDENSDTYYIVGKRRGAPLFPLTYDEQTIVNRSFIIAINGNNGSKKWIREIYTDSGGGSIPDNAITSLLLDDTSNVYIAGQIFRRYNDNTGKIYDPNGTYAYSFVPTPHTGLPTVIKLNSNGIVQWMKYPMDFAPSYLGNTPLNPQGIAVNGDEIAFGSEESYFIWDGFPQNYLPNHKPDPTLLRFDKQSGTTLGMHRIPGFSDEVQYMTAVAVDNDGNYITGGSFQANLFMNNTLGIPPLISTGQADFFVAKLASSECGSGNMGTNNPNKISINLFPNPTTGIVNIETSETLAGYTIYDMSGRQIQKGLFLGNNQIDLHNESKGVYFIKINTLQGTSSTVKIIKQ